MITRRALISAAALQAQTPDWRALLARSITHDDENLEKMRSYVFEIYDVARAPRYLRESQFYEVNLVGPGMYFRKVKQNDMMLSPEETRLEQSRLREHLARPAVTDAGAAWRKERDLLKTWLDTHQFEFKGRRVMDHRPVLIIDSKPPAKGAPEGLAFLTSAHCRLALDEETGHWVEATCDIYRRTIYSLNQLLLGRLSLPYSPGLVNRGDLADGATLTIRLQRLEDGLWVPKYYRNQRMSFSSELTFSNFHKFTSESQLLTDPQ